MQQMKYVVKQVGNTEEIYIFPHWINHSDFAKKLKGKIISAGFTDGHACYGESISIGISARKTEDTALLGD